VGVLAGAVLCRSTTLRAAAHRGFVTTIARGPLTLSLMHPGTEKVGVRHRVVRSPVVALHSVARQMPQAPVSRF
jgi:hypothetical protein